MLSYFSYLMSVAIYFLAITLIVKQLVLRYFPRFMKYVKKGLSRREEIRVTGFRSLLRHHLQGYTFIIISALFIVLMSIILLDNFKCSYLTFFTVMYITLYLLSAISFMITEYYLIQKTLKEDD